jgi:recombinational DNA repair protein RecR
LRTKDELEDIRNYNFNFFVRGSVELMAGIHSQNKQFLNLKKNLLFYDMAGVILSCQLSLKKH